MTKAKANILQTQEKIQRALVKELKARDAIIKMFIDYMGHDNYRCLLELNKGGKRW